MANETEVDKQYLIDQLVQLVSNKESALVSILTDKKRSIMLRFSSGTLISSFCRSRNVEDAIAALVECESLRFNQTAAQEKSAPEVMPALEFLQAISPDDKEITLEATVTEQELVQASSSENVSPAAVDSDLQNTLCDIARDYIGPVADLLVANIFSRQLSLEETVETIARSIPIAEHADAFRKRVADLNLVPESAPAPPKNDVRPLEFL